MLSQPDIAAPGVSILAGSSPYDSFMDGGFALHSGTSMATPHVSGIVALLKALHSNWSPAAIRSALVTTGSSITVMITNKNCNFWCKLINHINAKFRDSMEDGSIRRAYLR